MQANECNTHTTYTYSPTQLTSIAIGLDTQPNTNIVVVLLI